MSKFYTYLNKFAIPKPKSFFQMPIYDSVTTASNEGIVNELKELGLNQIMHTESQGQFCVDRDTMNQHYQRWCEKAGEIPDKRSKFCENISKLDKRITFKRYKDNGATPYGFFFPVEFTPI